MRKGTSWKREGRKPENTVWRWKNLGLLPPPVFHTLSLFFFSRRSSCTRHTRAYRVTWKRHRFDSDTAFLRPYYEINIFRWNILCKEFHAKYNAELKSRVSRNRKSPVSSLTSNPPRVALARPLYLYRQTIRESRRRETFGPLSVSKRCNVPAGANAAVCAATASYLFQLLMSLQGASRTHT